MKEGEFEQFPTMGGAQEVPGIEIAVDEPGFVKRADGVEGLVDEVEPGRGIERPGLDDLVEALAVEQFKDLVGAVFGIAAPVEELDPAGMEDRQFMGRGVGAGLEGQAKGDVVSGRVVAGAKDVGFAAGADRLE